jgi:hypothetical protein
MSRITAAELKDSGFLMNYRIIRKWASRNYNLPEGDLELLVYLDGLNFFTKYDFEKGAYAFSWDNKRWNRLLKEGWIVVWRERNQTTQKHNIYKVSTRCKTLIARMYRMLLGEEAIPTSRRNSIIRGKTYTDAVLRDVIKRTNKRNKL